MPDTITREQIQERITEALVEFGAERDQIAPEVTFTALDIDSLDMVELAQIVEDEYGVIIREEDVINLDTVGKAVDLVVARL